MAHGACHDQAREIEDRWIGSLGISSAIAAKSRDHRRKLLGVLIRISNLADRARRRSQMSGMGRVSRAPRELSVARNCTRDEGGPFEFGDQEPISSHRKLLRAKAVVVLCQEGARAPCCTR